MIYINDQAHTIEKQVSIQELFSSLNIEVKKGVALAVNNKVVPRSQWNSFSVNNNDKLLLITATQGG